MQKPIKAKVVEKKFIGENVFILGIHHPLLLQECKPGQFVNVRCSPFYEPLLRRPLSIFDIDKERGELSLLIRIVGKGTKLLSRLEKGDELDVLGPLGNSFPYENYENPLLIAGGIGVAPLHFLAKTLDQPTFIFGARSKDGLYALDELKRFAKVLVFTEDGSEGERGLATDKLPQLILEHDVIFACGPVGMLREVARIAKEMGTPSFLSLEERMACGFGSCLGCAVRTREGYKRVCKDGPIMPGEEVIL